MLLLLLIFESYYTTRIFFCHIHDMRCGPYFFLPCAFILPLLGLCSLAQDSEFENLFSPICMEMAVEND